MISPSEYPAFRDIDLQAGKFLGRLCKSPQHASLISLAGACVSRAASEGHICLPLDMLQEQLSILSGGEKYTKSRLQEALLLTGVVTSPGNAAPLILDSQDNLYMYRYYCYERVIARQLLERCQHSESFDVQAIHSILESLFSGYGGMATPDLQLSAAALSLISPLLVVSGGPGTGKTYTAARILAAHIALAERPLRIQLAAPTGKAAARLKESMLSALSGLDETVSRHFPDDVRTIHRLLGFRPGSGQFTHNRDNLLHLDLVLVDEASMIDIPLMAALLEALPPSCRLVLFGDRHQLASVEAGNLFGDICGAATGGWSTDRCRQMKLLTGYMFSPNVNASPMDDSLIELQKSFRFREESGISKVARAIQSGKEETLTACLASRHEDFFHYGGCCPEEDQDWLKRFVEKEYRPVLAAGSAKEALQHFEKSRILCAVHHGNLGVHALNSQVERILAIQNRSGGQHYQGQPVIILKNDYDQELFNGDTGILWPDASGRLQGWFPAADGSLRRLSPHLLPLHQTAYALTVHKSQGSEFSQVLLALPERDSPVLSRELLYTGITRCKRELTIFAPTQLLLQTMKRRIKRYSGLRQALHLYPKISVC
ncbi:MAG: exodeoxyribonuclease V subunit alpha [Deltaproteobacteria bacterium]|nr:MAG: exodeoxyribonuclease V subunit alpha [Deltaproteobacteria bacterium]